MPIFPNQYPEKLNPSNEDKLLMADGESNNAIKSVQIKNILGIIPEPDFGITKTKPEDLSKVKAIYWKGVIGGFDVSVSGTKITAKKQQLFTATNPNNISVSALFSALGITVAAGARNHLIDGSNAKMLLNINCDSFYSTTYNMVFGAKYAAVASTNIEIWVASGGGNNDGILVLEWEYGSLETLASKTLAGAIYVWEG